MLKLVTPWAPGKTALEAVRRANEIIADYARQGFDLTLRQLYYQFVSRDWIANKQSEYKRLGDIVSKGRRAGLIDWDAIVDRTRSLRGLTTFGSPADAIADAAERFYMDPWEKQEWYVECWFEKDALMGVFQRPCLDWRLNFFSCRGYASDSEVFSAARRLRRISHDGRKTLILHFGDHDPSGIDMTRDIQDRLYLFGADVEVIRIALTMAQIEEHNPPPNPAKESDSRFASYKEKYGDESWELDALNPTIISGLIESEIERVLDQDLWDEFLADEVNQRNRMRETAENWE